MLTPGSGEMVMFSSHLSVDKFFQSRGMKFSIKAQDRKCILPFSELIRKFIYLLYCFCLSKLLHGLTVGSVLY